MEKLTFESWIAGVYSLENKDDINSIGLDDWIDSIEYDDWCNYAERYAEEKIKESELLKELTK